MIAGQAPTGMSGLGQAQTVAAPPPSGMSGAKPAGMGGVKPTDLQGAKPFSSSTPTSKPLATGVTNIDQLARTPPKAPGGGRLAKLLRRLGPRGKMIGMAGLAGGIGGGADEAIEALSQ